MLPDPAVPVLLSLLLILQNGQYLGPPKNRAFLRGFGVFSGHLKKTVFFFKRRFLRRIGILIYGESTVIHAD